MDIPSSVLKIEEGAFSGCCDLKEVKLPDGLKSIEKYTFEGCSSLRKVYIPDSVARIKSGAFDCRSLSNIIIPNGVLCIDAYAIGCGSLEKIIIPSSVTSIGRQDFASVIETRYGDHEFSSLKKIIINYDSYQNLISLIGDSKEFFEHIPSKCQLSFAGPKLFFFQKMKLQFLLKEQSVTFLEGQVPNENPKNFEERDVSKLDEDIQKIINEINNLCSSLSDENKKIINDSINKLIDEYEKNKKQLKPEFGKKETVLSLDNHNIAMLKPQLLSDLEMIKLNLSREDKLIQLLSELDSYKKILNKDVDELSIEHASIESMIQNIIYFCKYVGITKKDEYINQLNKYIDIAKKEASDELLNFSDKQIVLDTNEKHDIGMQLKLNISKLYDEVESYSNKVRPFQELLEVLNAKEVVKKEEFGDGIFEIINGIKYVIHHLSDSEYQDELEDKFSNIVHKYFNEIEKLLEKPEELNHSKYEELEFNLRKELQLLLELVNNYAYLDSYMEKDVNKTNLLSQLQSCLNIIDGGKVVTINDEQRLELFTSTIIELNNSILSNKEIDNSNRNKIMLKLSKIINDYINQLQENTVDSLNKYDLIQKEFLMKVMGVKIEIDQYVHDMNEYNEHIR